jgi:hypothetical protein
LSSRSPAEGTLNTQRYLQFATNRAPSGNHVCAVSLSYTNWKTVDVIMNVPIHVLVSCTGRKRLQPLPSLRASRLTRVNAEARAASWLDRIAAARPVLPAADLYQGEHWGIARRMIADDRVKVWIASAGYGLVDPHTLLAPYAATFSAGQADSITLAVSFAEADTERRQWWRSLRAHSPQCDTRSLVDLVSEGPVLVATSRSYLAAMSDELLEADAQTPGRLVLTTIGAVPVQLRHLRTPATGALRTVLGGSMQAISIRTAERIIRDVDGNCLTHATATDLLERLMAKAQPPEHPARSRLTDGEISAFIEAALGDDAWSRTALLRGLRDAGMACEQARFRRLYDITKGDR